MLQSFADRYHGYWGDGMRAKLGLGDAQPGDGELIDDLLALLHTQKVDFTSCFRALSSSLLGDAAPIRSLFVEPSAVDAWAARWRTRLSSQPRDPQAIAAAMDRVNPVYIPRNHLVEEALAAATDDDLGPFLRLLGRARPAVRRTTRSGALRSAGPAELRPVPHVLRYLKPLMPARTIKRRRSG